ALGTHVTDSRSDRVAIRGAGEFGHRGRDRRRDGRRQDHDSSGVHSQAPCTQALARASLPRERVIVPGPTTCLCCGGKRLRKLGETVTETLESVPRQWKVIQHVREKLTCRDCEKISQAPAPFYVIARGWAGPSLLAMMLLEKFGQHQPLNRQAERYAKEA